MSDQYQLLNQPGRKSTKGYREKGKINEQTKRKQEKEQARGRERRSTVVAHGNAVRTGKETLNDGSAEQSPNGRSTR